MTPRALTPELIHPSESFQDFSENMYRDYRNRNNPQSSFPLPESDGSFAWPEKSVGSTALRYIFWQHIEENSGSLPRAVEGCDILALEGVGSLDPNNPNLSHLRVSRNNRRIIVNGLLGADLSPHEQRVFDGALESGKVIPDDISSQEFWLNQVNSDYRPAIKSFIGSGTRLEWLDVEAKHSHKMSQLEKKDNEALYDFNYQFRAGANFDHLVQRLIRAKKPEADVMDFREKITQNQLEKLVRQYPGKNIAVVYGSAHLVLTRMISQPDMSTQRIFLESGNAEVAERSSNIHSVGSANQAVLRVSRSAPELLIRLEVMDRMAFTLLSGKKDISKYSRLSSAQRTEMLEQVRSLWADEIPLDSAQNIKRIRKRLKVTKKILKP